MRWNSREISFLPKTWQSIVVAACRLVVAAFFFSNIDLESSFIILSHGFFSFDTVCTMLFKCLWVGCWILLLTLLLVYVCNACQTIVMASDQFSHMNVSFTMQLIVNWGQQCFRSYYYRIVTAITITTDAHIMLSRSLSMSRSFHLSLSLSPSIVPLHQFCVLMELKKMLDNNNRYICFQVHKRKPP